MTLFYVLSYIYTWTVDPIESRRRDYGSKTKFFESIWISRYRTHATDFFLSFLKFTRAMHSRWERNSFDRDDNAIFARMPPRPTAGRSCEEMHRADYLEPRKWNTVISVSRERNPISLLRRGFVRMPRNKGGYLLPPSLSFRGAKSRNAKSLISSKFL